MRFLVDEMPAFSDECPFCKEEWNDERWVYRCSLTDTECNLTETECNGLKAV